jgi:hypothetical protein
MISIREEALPREVVNKITNWFNQREASLVQEIALDLQTRHEVRAMEQAHAYQPGQQGFTVTERTEWEKVKRYQIFLDVFRELKDARDPVNIKIHHHHAD